jgi:lipopolysaccharide export system permease protein
LFISRSNELTALRTLGIRHQSVISVFLLLAFSLSGICIFFDFAFVPVANRKVSEIWHVKLNKKEKKGVLQGDLLFYKGDNQVWVAEEISPNAKEIKNLIIFYTDNDNKSNNVYFINKLSYRKQKDWNATGLSEIKILSHENNVTDGNFSSLDKFNEKILALKEKPADFIAQRKPVSELGFNALFASILKSRKTGLINNEAETFFLNKILFPLLSFSLCFAFLPMVLPAKKDEIVIVMTKAIILATIAWASWKFCINIGKSGKISPLIPFVSIHAGLFFLGFYNLKKIKF